MKTSLRFRVAVLIAILGVAAADASVPAAAPPPSLSRHVAIDNVCAWPMLVPRRDGTFAAVIFNRPSHGRMAGDVEVWAMGAASREAPAR